MALTKEETLMQSIRLHRLNVDRFKRLVVINERELHEAEAALKRLNEENMRKGGEDLLHPTEEGLVYNDHQRED